MGIQNRINVNVPVTDIGSGKKSSSGTSTNIDSNISSRQKNSSVDIYEDFDVTNSNNVGVSQSAIDANMDGIKRNIFEIDKRIDGLKKEIDDSNQLREDFLYQYGDYDYVDDYELVVGNNGVMSSEEFRDYYREILRGNSVDGVDEDALNQAVLEYDIRLNQAFSEFSQGKYSSYSDFEMQISKNQNQLNSEYFLKHQAEKSYEEASFDFYALSNQFNNNYDFSSTYRDKIKASVYDEAIDFIVNGGLYGCASWKDAERLYNYDINGNMKNLGTPLSAFDLLECVCESKYGITPENLRKLSKDEASKLITDFENDGFYWASDAYSIYKYMDDKELALYKTIFQKNGQAIDYYKAIEEKINSLQGLEDAMSFFDSILGNSGYQLDDVRFVVDEKGQLSIYTQDDNGAWVPNYELSTNFATISSSFFEGMGDGTFSFFEGFGNIFTGSDDKCRLDFKKMYIATFLSENAVLKGSYDVGSGIGNMLPSITLSAFLGYAGVPASLQENVGYLFMGVSTYGNELHNYRVQGVPEENAQIGALLKGGLEFLTGKLFGRIPGLNKEASISIGEYINMANVAMQKMRFSNLVKNVNWGGLLKAIGSNMAHEGFEELFQTYLEAGIDSATMHQSYDFIDTSKEALYSFLMGAFTSGIMSGSNVGVQFTFHGVNYAMNRQQVQEFLVKEHHNIQSDLSDYKISDVDVKQDVSSHTSSVEEVDVMVDTNSHDSFQRISDSVKEDILKYQPAENSFFSPAGDFGTTETTLSVVSSHIDMDSIISNVDSRVSRFESEHSVSMESIIDGVKGRVPDSKGTAKECYYVTVDGITYALLKYNANTKQLRDSFIRMNATYSMVEEGMHTPSTVDYAIVDGVMYELQENVEGIQLFGKNNDQKSLQILNQCSNEQLISFMKDIAILYSNGYDMDYSGDNIYITEDGNISIIDLDVSDVQNNRAIDYQTVLNSLPNRLSMLFLDSTRAESIDFDTLSNIGKKWMEACYQYLQSQGLSDSEIRSYLEGIDTNSFGIDGDTKIQIIDDINSKNREFSFDVGEHFITREDGSQILSSDYKKISLGDVHSFLKSYLDSNGSITSSDIRVNQFLASHDMSINELTCAVGTILQNDELLENIDIDKNTLIKFYRNYHSSIDIDAINLENVLRDELPDIFIKNFGKYLGYSADEVKSKIADSIRIFTNEEYSLLERESGSNGFNSGDKVFVNIDALNKNMVNQGIKEAALKVLSLDEVNHSFVRDIFVHEILHLFTRNENGDTGFDYANMDKNIYFYQSRAFTEAATEYINTRLSNNLYQTTKLSNSQYLGGMNILNVLINSNIITYDDLLTCYFNNDLEGLLTKIQEGDARFKPYTDDEISQLCELFYQITLGNGNKNTIYQQIVGLISSHKMNYAIPVQSYTENDLNNIIQNQFNSSNPPVMVNFNLNSNFPTDLKELALTMGFIEKDNMLMYFNPNALDIYEGYLADIKESNPELYQKCMDNMKLLLGKRKVADSSVVLDDDVVNFVGDVQYSNPQLASDYINRINNLKVTCHALVSKKEQRGYLANFDKRRLETYQGNIRDLQARLNELVIHQTNDIFANMPSIIGASDSAMSIIYNHFYHMFSYGKKTYGIAQSCVASLLVFEYDKKEYTFSQWRAFCNNIVANGGIAPRPDDTIITEEYDNLRRKIMKKYKLSLIDASIILSAIDNDAGACSYASVCNEILASFIGKEREFERKFGYPLYNKYGLNDVELMLDLYMFANMKENGGEYFKRKFLSRKKVAIVSDAYNPSKIDPLGRVMLDGQKQNRLSGRDGRKVDIVADFLKSKGVNYRGGVLHNGYLGDDIISCRRNMNSLMRDMCDRIEKGSQFSISIYRDDNSRVRMLSMDPNSYHDCSTDDFRGGHSVYITGINLDGFIVSSWGRQYMIPFKDLWTSSFVINESIINQ